jgi:hypothetical protein
MPDDDISEQDLYDLILRRLNEAGAQELANQTMQVVRRGVVIQGEDEAGEGKTKTLRPMLPVEALGVALEFLITGLQVPLMVNKATTTLECAKIIWHVDGPPDIVESMVSDTETGLPFVEDSVEGPDLTKAEDHVSLREPDLGSDAAERSALMPISLDFDVIIFGGALKAVVDLKQELQIRFPEVV